MPKPRIYITPSILSADLSRLQEEVASIEPYADWLQIDVMDGHFVPNLSFGAPLLKNLKTRLPLDIHLMVKNPAERLEEFAALHAHNITFHAEAVPERDAQRALISAIKKKCKSVGIAINPDTPTSAIRDLLNNVDLVLCMTVVPGFSGQKFREDVLPKIAEVKKCAPQVMIQVDGGIDAQTAKLCREAGATNLVAATSIFGTKDRKAAIEALRG
jgi:ribulose-phosphate 3-epimerase